MSRRSLAALVTGAAAAMACYFLVARPPGIASYLIFYLGTPAVAGVLELVLDDQRLRNHICWSVFDS